MNFMENLQQQIDTDSNMSVTENGAIGYKTTGKALLDLNFSVSSLRSADPKIILDKFTAAFKEDPNIAMKWLFFARDIREGLGERRLFKIVFRHLCNIMPNDVYKFISMIPEYGRWDDLLALFDTPLEKYTVKVIAEQLTEDANNYYDGKSVSLLAKWLPSINSSSKDSRKLALRIIDHLGIKPVYYRRTLSNLRHRIDIVERKMSSGEWDQIDYGHVPSKANLRYSNAFAAHDADRRAEYLSKLSTGEAKINAGTIYPYEIAYNVRVGKMDMTTLDGLWRALPNTITDPNSRTIVVSDGSGSMFEQISRQTSAEAIDVSIAMAIYFAEKLSGEFHNKFITFSMHPRLISLDGLNTITDKVKHVSMYNECANTDIEAVFKLILRTAVGNEERGKMKQEDLPANILIVSDMEFDECAMSSAGGYRSFADVALFEQMAKLYASEGYKLPRIVFWNVCSRTCTIPMKENDMGVCLVSGFSPNIADMVLSNETDPYKALVTKLMTDRYKDIVL